MSTLAALRKLRITSIKTGNGAIQLDQVETKVSSLLQDLKGSREAKTSALKLLLSYQVLLSVDQKNQLVSILGDILKSENIEVKGSAALLLEMLIEQDNIHKIVHDFAAIQHLAGMLGSSFQIKKYAYRALYKISNFKHTLPKLDFYGVLKHALSEIQKEHIQISSDTCVLLLANFAEDSTYGTQMMTNGALTSLLNLLRTPATTPVKLIAPAVKAVRNLARLDDVRRRAVIQAGAVQLLAGVVARPPSLLFPHTQINAALVVCDLATTKDDTSQELLVRAGIGDLLVGCLRHPSSELKRNATIAIERWMYNDDRMTLYAIEFFLSLIQNGVQVSPRVKELMQSLKPLSKPKPESPPIAALIADIKQRPESINDELAKLRAENARLTSNLTAQQAYVKNLETAIGKASLQTGSGGAEATMDFSGIRNLEELNKLEEKLMQQRNSVIHDMQDRLVCPVCLDKTRDSALSPCGHTLCSVCAQKILASAKCHVCRLKVERVGKMYL